MVVVLLLFVCLFPLGVVLGHVCCVPRRRLSGVARFPKVESDMATREKLSAAFADTFPPHGLVISIRPSGIRPN